MEPWSERNFVPFQGTGQKLGASDESGEQVVNQLVSEVMGAPAEAAKLVDSSPEDDAVVAEDDGQTQGGSPEPSPGATPEQTPDPQYPDQKFDYPTVIRFITNMTVIVQSWVVGISDLSSRDQAMLEDFCFSAALWVSRANHIQHNVGPESQVDHRELNSGWLYHHETFADLKKQFAVRGIQEEKGLDEEKGKMDLDEEVDTLWKDSRGNKLNQKLWLSTSSYVCCVR